MFVSIAHVSPYCNEVICRILNPLQHVPLPYLFIIVEYYQLVYIWEAVLAISHFRLSYQYCPVSVILTSVGQRIWKRKAIEHDYTIRAFSKPLLVVIE